jgi:putative spermidine/putrescine transport system ATP-binding protein
VPDGTNDLIVRELTFSYDGKPAVRNVSFEVASGEITALLGPSGCGKTTVLRAIAGFLPVKRGAISLAGKDLASVPLRSRRIGMVFQNYALFPHMTVAENIGYPLSCHGWPRSKRRARIAELMDIVRLTGLERRFPRSLSGGQQQRVAVARALAVDPAVLLLDEPFAALDRALRIDLQMELIRLQRTLGITMIIVTHDQEEAQSLASRVVVMNNGVVEQAGTPTEVYDNPAGLFVNGFVGQSSRLRARVMCKENAATRLQMSTGEMLEMPRSLRFIEGSEVVLTARPEDLKLSADTVPGGLEATLLFSIPQGPDVLHSLTLSDGTELKVLERRDRSVVPAAREGRLHVSLDMNRLHVFPAPENEIPHQPKNGAKQ